MEGNLLEPFQAASQLSVSISTIKRFIDRGQLGAYNVGAGKYRVFRISQESLDRFKKSRLVNDP